eukprot:scaffold1535_cov382-Prasinococcus_capsulatus_cf.AAC.23
MGLGPRLVHRKANAIDTDCTAHLGMELSRGALFGHRRPVGPRAWRWAPTRAWIDTSAGWPPTTYHDGTLGLKPLVCKPYQWMNYTNYMVHSHQSRRKLSLSGMESAGIGII